MPLLLLAALIQLRGEPLAGGRVMGSADLPLERAAGGDTPVLTLSTAQGPLRLLLDTGATSTMVTPQLLQRLGWSSRTVAPGAFALAGGGSGCGDLRPRRTRLPALELMARPGRGSGRVRLQGIEALVLPAAALPPGVDGVLGAPTLRRQPFWIDPHGHRLAFGASALRRSGWGPSEPSTRPMAAAAASTAEAGPRRLLLRWHQGVPLLGLRTPHGVVAALADTGAEGLFLSGELARSLPLLGNGQPLRLMGFCGEQPVLQHGLAGLQLAGIGGRGGNAAPDGSGQADSVQDELVQVTSVIVTTNPIFRVLGIQAIVGQELLRHRRQLWRLDLDPPQLMLQ